jgi:hypothetical protein
LVVILNEVKNPLGHCQCSLRNLSGFFSTLRMTWGFESGYNVFLTTQELKALINKFFGVCRVLYSSKSDGGDLGVCDFLK